MRERSPEAYQTVKENIDAIYQSKKDAMATLGKGPGCLAIDITDQSITWIAGKIYFDSKRISLIHRIRKHGRMFMAPREYSYEKVADDHYRILKEIGSEYEELKHLADWIESELNKEGEK